MYGPVQVRNGVKTYMRTTHGNDVTFTEELHFQVKDGNTTKNDEVGRPRDLALELLNDWNSKQADWATRNNCAVRFTYWLK